MNKEDLVDAILVLCHKYYVEINKFDPQGLSRTEKATVTAKYKEKLLELLASQDQT